MRNFSVKLIREYHFVAGISTDVRMLLLIRIRPARRHGTDKMAEITGRK